MSIEKYQHGGSNRMGWVGWMETEQSFGENQVAHVNTGEELVPIRNTTFLNSHKDVQDREVITFEHDRQIKQSPVIFRDLK